MLIEEIKEAQLIARKTRNSIEATLLTTLIGEAEMYGKNHGNRASTDEEVLRVVKKFETGLVDTINFIITRGDIFDVRLEQSRQELEIILRFLPAKLTDLQVQKDIGTIMSTLSLPREQKSMGVIVKELKVKYGNQFDGSQVSNVYKQILI